MARFVTSLNSAPLRAQTTRTPLRTATARPNSSTARPDFQAVLTNAAPAESKPVSGLAGLVSGNARVTVMAPAAAAEPTTLAPPTAESVFGSNPWIGNASGTGPLGVYYYNPMYFATAQTAQKVAEMLGGKVVQQNLFCGSAGPFQQSQPNYMVELTNGKLVNPGIVASFYNNGFPQSYIDRLVANEVNG